MPLTYYRSDDASAPTLTGTVGSLVALLDAVLVTGYGAKAAAGWTKPYTGTNKAVFRMATGAGKNGHYLRVLDDGTVTDGAARTAAIIGYKAMTTVDAGTDDFPLVGQRVNSAGLLVTKSNTLDTTARPWLIVADDTFFFFFSQHLFTTFTGNWDARCTTFMFGQCDSFQPGDTNATLISGRNAGVYTDTTGLTEATRGVPTSFSTTTRNFLAKDVFGYQSAPVQLCTSGFADAAASAAGGSNGNISPADTALVYTQVNAHEKDFATTVSIARCTVPYYYQFEGLTSGSLFQGILPLFTVLAGVGVDAGKTFLVIPQYHNSAGYVHMIQISGSR